MNAAAQPQSHLSIELNSFLDQLDGRDSTVGDIVDRIGDRGFGLLLLILALPAALPIPAPGYATPFGLVMVVLGFQMLFGRRLPWVPERLRSKTVPFKLLRFSVKNARIPLKVVEILIRPRFSPVARHRLLLPGLGLSVAVLAAMMSVPIPLTNTAPSFVIFLLAAGLLEEDGFFLICGMLLAPVAGLIAGFAIYLAVTQGPEAVENTIKPMFYGLFGL